MKRNGYKVIQKELKVYPDGSKRANLDVEITVDMLNLSQYVDTIVLVSGDEGFAYALNYLSERGKQIILTGFRANTSPSLMDSTDEFFDLESSLSEIVKKSPSPSSHHSELSQVEIYGSVPQLNNNTGTYSQYLAQQQRPNSSENNNTSIVNKKSTDPSGIPTRIIKRKEKKEPVE